MLTPALVPELGHVVERLELVLFWGLKPPEPPMLGIAPPSSKSGSSDNPQSPAPGATGAPARDPSAHGTLSE